MSLSGRPPTQIARCARTMIPARTARLLSSHGRSKRWLGAMSANLYTSTKAAPVHKRPNRRGNTECGDRCDRRSNDEPNVPEVTESNAVDTNQTYSNNNGS
jgi:hypothetical protein